MDGYEVNLTLLKIVLNSIDSIWAYFVEDLHFLNS